MRLFFFTRSPARSPPLKAEKEAWLRVNLEQAPAFRPRSRKVHSKTSALVADYRFWSAEHR